MVRKQSAIRGKRHSPVKITADSSVCRLRCASRKLNAPCRQLTNHHLKPSSGETYATFASAFLLVLLGPGRALDTRDPAQIARAFRDSPALNRTPKLLRAVLHSAHALSIPIKIGVHLVAQTQTFNWSIQHSLCTLECAYLLSKWLEALSTSQGIVSITPDDRKIASLVPITITMDSMLTRILLVICMSLEMGR